MLGDLVRPAGEVLWLSSLFLVSSAPTSMLATVTDAHMPGDLVQFANDD
jgi:hypothetical protein